MAYGITNCNVDAEIKKNNNMYQGYHNFTQINKEFMEYYI